MEDDNHLAYNEALSLAKSLHAQHYSHVKNWKPFDDLRGVISQIDNMTCGLVKDRPANRFYGEQRVEIKTQQRYGPVWLQYMADGYVGVTVDGALDADELREAAHLFVQLAEALERE